MHLNDIYLKPDFYESFSALAQPTENMGFKGLIYDYAPVPTAHDGKLISPSILQTLKTPEDMKDLWCDEGYYQMDPVQRYALQAGTPFSWSYKTPERTAIRSMVSSDDKITSYMNDNNIAQGITVPIHWHDGSLATLTGLVENLDDLAALEAHIPNLFLMAYRFHEKVIGSFTSNSLSKDLSPLSQRECECLSYSAEGLTAKQIARIINRSIPTVNMHINSAIQKLGASNRTQAVVRAIHYKLIN